MSTIYRGLTEPWILHHNSYVGGKHTYMYIHAPTDINEHTAVHDMQDKAAVVLMEVKHGVVATYHTEMY